MPSRLTFLVILPVILGALSLAFVALGLYGLVRGRPFIIRARWMLALVIVALSPQFFLPLFRFFGEDRYRSRGLDFMSLIAPLAMLVLLLYLALQMRGYMVFGTTQRTFRNALVSALSALNLKYEETLASIALPSVPAELQVAVHGWIGTGQLRMRGSGQSRLLADIAAGMKAYFNSEQVETNMTTAIAYVVFGILMGGMVVSLIILRTTLSSGSGV